MARSEEIAFRGTAVGLLLSWVHTLTIGPMRLFYWGLRGPGPLSVRLLGGGRLVVTVETIAACMQFVADSKLGIGLLTRLALIERFIRISQVVTMGHTNAEMLEVARAILKVRPEVPGVIIEAGAWKGASAAKLSLCAYLTGRKLIVFDSFKGIPENDEVQSTRDLPEVIFKEGVYAGSLDEVRAVIRDHGAIDVCEFVEGWFEETMPSFRQDIVVGYLDVDLVASTRTCLSHLYPLLVPGGALYSQDAHLDKVVHLLKDQDFWYRDLRVPAPAIPGLGTKKLVPIRKPS